MELIIKKLEQLEISDNELPQEIQNEINIYEQDNDEYNEKVNQLEAEGKEEDEIDLILEEESELLDERQQEIVNYIDNWYLSKNKQIVPQTQRQIQPQKPQVINAKEKKSDGAFVIGFFALIITLGAVNMFKK